MTIAQAPAERRVVLNDVSWNLYQRMRAEIGDAPVKLIFDRGRLEIMSPSNLHEQVKKVIARLIEAYSDMTGTVVEGLGSTTFSREDLQKGLEPDECYYVARAAEIIGKEELDLAIDPPPDLAIEIDISPPDVARQPIYAALGVPEVWRYDGSRLHFMRRRDDSTYVVAERSTSLPELPIEQLNAFIDIGLSKGQSAAVVAMREWLRSR
ncbi:MAG: Uma2 family endonuclease [Tepidisphaeraceae bacterium]